MDTAVGKFANGLCDICGQSYRYLDLRKNWKGFMVCPEDYEPKSPQIGQLKFKGDAIALLNPRPDRTEPLVVFVGLPGDSAFQSEGSASDTINMQPFPTQSPVEGVGSVGTVTIVIS